MNIDRHKLQGVTEHDIKQTQDELTEEQKREYEEKMLMENYRELRFLERKIHIKEEFERDEGDIEELRDEKEEIKQEIEELEQRV